MNDAADGLTPVDVKNLDVPGILPGVIALLGELGPGAIITEEGMARLFSRHPVSIKRAVERGELPPACRLFGGNAWTVGAIIHHIEKRLEEAAKEMATINQKIARLSS